MKTSCFVNFNAPSWHELQVRPSFFSKPTIVAASWGPKSGLLFGCPSHLFQWIAAVTIRNQHHPLQLYSSQMSAEIAAALKESRERTQALALALNLNYHLIQLWYPGIDVVDRLGVEGNKWNVLKHFFTLYNNKL